MLSKVLGSAVANAAVKEKVDEDALCVTQIMVDPGPTENGGWPAPWVAPIG